MVLEIEYVKNWIENGTRTIQLVMAKADQLTTFSRMHRIREGPMVEQKCKHFRVKHFRGAALVQQMMSDAELPWSHGTAS